FLYHNNGDGTFTRIMNGPPGTATGNSQGCAWGDYDNDGRLDLYVTHYQSKNRLYHNNGDGTFTTVSNQPPVLDSSAGPSCWGDSDKDGFPDLFVSGNNADYLYHNNGNPNSWITVQCQGRVSNRAAIGAKVRVKATIGGRPTWQLREVSGGGATGSQNDLRC